MCKGARITGDSGKSEWVQGPAAGGPLTEQDALVAACGHFLCVVVCTDREVAGWWSGAGKDGQDFLLCDTGLLRQSLLHSDLISLIM